LSSVANLRVKVDSTTQVLSTRPAPFLVSTTTRSASVLAASYPFLDVFWTMIVIVAWVVWLWLLITVSGDLFRRRDTSGIGEAVWVVFLVLTRTSASSST
jgi:hypothetical protein